MSTLLRSLTASPMPILSTTLSRRGTCIALVKPNCSVSLPRMSRSYSVRRRGVYAVSAIDLSSRALGDAHLGAILLNLETDAGRLAVLADERNVRQLDWRLLGDDAAFLRLRLLLVTLHQIDAANQRTTFRRTHLEHFTGTTLVAARDDDDLIALADLGSHYSTSGASEMIFMWFLARSSRGTGPKIRVPTGSDRLLISTAALRSKRITAPSARRMSLRTRTTTAFMTSPFFTLPRGIASLIDTTMMSPTVAYRRLDPPSTLMHMTRRAPELSATSR